MSTTKSGTAERHSGVDNRPQAPKQVHHGQTLAAWVGSLTAMVAFFVGGIAVVLQNWTMFTIGVVLLVLAAVAGKILQKMGHGAY